MERGGGEQRKGEPHGEPHVLLRPSPLAWGLMGEFCVLRGPSQGDRAKKAVAQVLSSLRAKAQCCGGAVAETSDGFEVPCARARVPLTRFPGTVRAAASPRGAPRPRSVWPMSARTAWAAELCGPVGPRRGWRLLTCWTRRAWGPDVTVVDLNELRGPLGRKSGVLSGNPGGQWLC